MPRDLGLCAHIVYAIKKKNTVLSPLEETLFKTYSKQFSFDTNSSVYIVIHVAGFYQIFEIADTQLCFPICDVHSFVLMRLSCLL